MSLKTVLKWQGADVILVVLGVLALAGLGIGLGVWAKHDADKLPPPPPFVKAQGTLEVWDDHESGVRCYYANHGTTGALACVVLSADGGIR